MCLPRIDRGGRMGVLRRGKEDRGWGKIWDKDEILGGGGGGRKLYCE